LAEGAPTSGESSDESCIAGQPPRTMKIHLIDGTYELFRNYYGAPPKKTPGGREIGATLGVLRSLLALLAQTGTRPTTRWRPGRRASGTSRPSTRC